MTLFHIFILKLFSSPKLWCSDHRVLGINTIGHICKNTLFAVRSNYNTIEVTTGLFSYNKTVNLNAVNGQQGWEFAHLFSERIARFLPNSEPMSDSLSHSFLVSDLSDSLNSSERPSLRSLILGEQLERIANSRSYLVSNLSETLTVAQFWWATWAICSHRSDGLSDCKQIAQFAHQIWANEQTAHVFGKKWVISSENRWSISQLCWDLVSHPSVSKDPVIVLIGPLQHHVHHSVGTDFLYTPCTAYCTWLKGGGNTARFFLVPTWSLLKCGC